MTNELENGLHADVVIIGSGGAGATIAGEALRAGRTVVLVEAGAPHDAGSPGAHLRNLAPTDDEMDEFDRLMTDALTHHGNVVDQPGEVNGFRVVHAVGGELTVWFNNCPIPWEAERNSAIPAEAWPRLLKRADQLLHVKQPQESERGRRLLERIAGILPPLPAGREAQVMPTGLRQDDDGRRFTGARELLFGSGPDEPAGLTLLSSTVARRILVESGRVTGIEVHAVAGGPATTVTGDAYVIAAGVIGTPQLLVASGFEHEAIGRYLMDHPGFATRVAFDHELLAGVPGDDPSFTVWVPASAPRPWHTQLSRTPWLTPLPDVPDSRTGDLISFAPTRPNHDNALIFDANGLDPLGLPSYTSRFRLSAEDREVVAAMIADHYRLMSALETPARSWAPTMGLPGTSEHLCGTTRMGTADDGTSVTDPHGRVWGLDNLYLGGNNLLSDPNSCNPTLQTVAIALHTSDHLLESIR